MKTNEPRRANAAIPILPAIAQVREGEGVPKNDQTTGQAFLGKKPNWRCGAPAGNRNAAKAVHSLSTIRKRIRALKRRAKILIARVPE